MSARRKARKKALDFLYEADIRKVSAGDLYRTRSSETLSQESYVAELLTGVQTHLEKIDELIITYAQGWDLDRMPSIDRNLLRIGLFEMLWSTDIDDKVAITEAVELSKELSTDDSASYINGVMGRVLAIKSALNL